MVYSKVALVSALKLLKKHGITSDQNNNVFLKSKSNIDLFTKHAIQYFENKWSQPLRI